MQIIITTLVDITSNGARKNEDKFKWYQEQNFLTLGQTLQLRTRILDQTTPIMEQRYPTEFGDYFKQLNEMQNIWEITFQVKGHSEQGLMEDFDWVPMIPNLNESVVFEKCYFTTKDPIFKNINFTITDK